MLSGGGYTVVRSRAGREATRILLMIPQCANILAHMLSGGGGVGYTVVEEQGRQATRLLLMISA
jgi:hypothetical protein